MSAKHNNLYDISNDEVSEGEDEKDDREEEKNEKDDREEKKNKKEVVEGDECNLIGR